MTEEQQKLISKIHVDRLLSKIFVFLYFVAVYKEYIAMSTDRNYFIWMIGLLILSIYSQYKANMSEKIFKEISKIEKPKEEHKLSKLIREKKEFTESQKKDKE